MTRTTIFSRLLLLALLATPAGAEVLRIATWNVALDRAGPGLLVKDLAEGEAQVEAVVRVLAALQADVVLLTSVDYDRGGVALDLLAEALAAAGTGLSAPLRRFGRTPGCRPASTWTGTAGPATA
jgi:hypothetical protein